MGPRTPQLQHLPLLPPALLHSQMLARTTLLPAVYSALKTASLPPLPPSHNHGPICMTRLSSAWPPSLPKASNLANQTHSFHLGVSATCSIATTCNTLLVPMLESTRLCETQQQPSHLRPREFTGAARRQRVGRSLQVNPSMNL
jgi:hypothetical protein